jgi:uncharacterized phage protein (TIGR02220 family)
MIRLANWDTGQIKDGQEIIKLKRGEFCHTERHLARSWKWSRGKVRRFLKWLENDERIMVHRTVQLTGHPRIVVTLCNYQKYQLPIKGSGTSNDTPDDTPDSTISNNNSKITISKDNNIPYENIIESLNRESGKKFRAKTKAFRILINARMSEGYTLEDFLLVNKNKSIEWKHSTKMNKHLNPETLYCAKHFDTYLNSGIVLGEPLGEKEFQSLYNSELIQTDTIKTARKIFRFALAGLNEEEARKYYEKEISPTWRDDDKIKKLYKEYQEGLGDKETATQV